MNNRRRFALTFGLLGIVCVAWYLRCFDAGFWSHWVVNDDARAQVSVFYKVQDPELFPHDLMTDYFHGFVPPFYRWFMSPAARLFDPLDFGKLLSFGNFFFAVIGAALTGYRFGGPGAAVAAGMLVLRCPFFFARCAGGVPRSFGSPLAFLFLAALVWGYWRTALVLVILAAGFYPPAFLFMFPAFVIAWLARRETRRSLLAFDPRAWLSSLLTLTLLFVVIAAGASRPAGIGRTVNLERASEMPEWSRDGGRFRVLPLASPIEEVSTGLAGLFVERGKTRVPDWVVSRFWRGGLPWCLAWIGLVLGALVVYRRGVEWRPLLALALFGACALSVYLLARVLAFHLYIPTRMLFYGLRPLSACAFVALTASAVMAGTARRWVAGAACLVVVLSLIAVRGDGTERRPNYEEVSPEIRSLCDFLMTLPKDVRVAGPPRIADFIAPFARRVAYVSYEGGHPLYDAYYAEIARRMKRFGETYYGEDTEAIRRFAREERVTHLIIDRDHFDEDPTHIPASFEPHNAALSRLKTLRSGGWLLQRPRTEWIVYEKGSLLVLDLTRI